MGRIRKKADIIERIDEIRNEPKGYMERTKEGEIYEGGYKNGYIKALQWVLNRS